MNIIAHRGLWNNKIKKNSFKAIKKCIDKNIPFETDIRDYNAKIFISHDPIKKFSNKLKLSKILKYINKKNKNVLLALNIKSDGIINNTLEILNKYNIKNFFFFDMSIPELFKNRNTNVYVGISDVVDEYNVVDFNGIWLDFFNGNYNLNKIKNLIDKYKNKNIVVVSPELHNEEYLSLWKLLKSLNLNDNIYLCTDKYDDAIEYFKKSRS